MMTTIFDPDSAEAHQRRATLQVLRDGTSRRYVPYQYSDEARMAVSVALATRRPLLLRGEAGIGKSTLALDAAVVLGWTYYEKVFTSRTTATDILWTSDAVRRLADASAAPDSARELRNYVTPEPLWWAFDPVSAATCGPDPGEELGRRDAGAVVLLDEIDKADPDVPNDLLQALGDDRFTIPELRLVVQRMRPLLLIVTRNQERDLTRAFLRRCVCLTLAPPSAPWLAAIATRHFPDVDRGLVDMLINVLMQHRAASPDGAHRPGVSELLDAIRACRALGIVDPEDPAWQQMTRVLMKKHEGA
jgi:MoxR-like ATPase